MVFEDISLVAADEATMTFELEPFEGTEETYELWPMEKSEGEPDVAELWECVFEAATFVDLLASSVHGPVDTGGL